MILTYKEWGLTIHFNKSEFMAINTHKVFHINIEANVTIKKVQNFQYLGVILNKKNINPEDIISQICKERQITVCLNLLYLDKNISLKQKKKRNC